MSADETRPTEAARELAEADFLATAAPPPLAPDRRIWPAFAAVVIALVLILVWQILAVAALTVVMIAAGTPPPQAPQKLVELVATPWAFIALGIGSQAAMLVTAVIAARLSGQPVTRRLGMHRPGLGPAGFIAVAFGSWLPLTVSLGLAYTLPETIPTDPSVAAMYEKMTWASALPFLLFISLAPGLCEEVLFRGYVQRQFLNRWGPWTAILLTSVLFALFHIMLHAIAVALPLGIWLGWLAWKTGSIWPGVVCHAFVNGSWNVYQVGAQLNLLPAEPPMPVWTAVGAIAVVAFAASISLVTSRRHLDSPVPAPALADEFP